MTVAGRAAQAARRLSRLDTHVALGKMLVLIGLLVAAVGLLIWWGVPIGRLPGDILIRRGSFSFYVPITTSVLASIVITIVLAVLKR